MSSVKRNGVSNGHDETHMTKKVRYEEEKSSGSEESGIEDEGSEEESSSDDSESEDEVEYQDQSEVYSAEQKLLKTAREISLALKNDKTKVARDGGLEAAREHLEKINTAFYERQRIKSDNKTIEVYDSRNLVDGGDLMDIALRNIKLGATGGLLNTEDFTKRMKIFLLRSSIQIDGEEDDPEKYYDGRHEFKKFNWFQLGTFLYSRGHRAPTTNHLLGPLEIEKKIRQFKARIVDKPVGDIVTAEKVSGDDINGQSINQTPNAVQECYKVFREEAKGEKINIFKFFINPFSFSQSVENMFYTSFLIRDGRLELGEDEDGYPTVCDLPPLPQDPKARERVILERRDKPSNHIIFQLEYDSWRNLIEKLNITDTYLPNRPEVD